MFLQCNSFTMLAVFWCRHINNYCFLVNILFCIPKTHSAGYRNQSEVVCIIYGVPNSGVMTGVSRS